MHLTPGNQVVMGKLSVAFFAIMAIQAAFGGVTRSIGYGQEDVQDLVRQVALVSNEIIDTFKTTSLRHANEWENHEFDQDIEDIIKYLEDLTTIHYDGTTEVFANVLLELRTIRTYYQQLCTCSDVPTIRQLEKSTALALKRIVYLIESWGRYFEEESYNREIKSTQRTGSSNYDIKTILARIVLALRKLNEHVNSFKQRNSNWDNKWVGGYQNNEWPRKYMQNKWSGDNLNNQKTSNPKNYEWPSDYMTNQWSEKLMNVPFPRDFSEGKWSPEPTSWQWQRNYLERNCGLDSSSNNWASSELLSSEKAINSVINELEVTLQRINFDNVLMKRTLVHLIREYMANLKEFSVPNLHHFYELFLGSDVTSHSVREMKMQVFTFAQDFASDIESMPGTARVAFLKATAIFQSRLHNMVEVNTPIRYLVLRMHALADLLSTGYEVISAKSASQKYLVEENLRNFVQQLENFISGIERTLVGKDAGINWRRIVSSLLKGGSEQSLALSIQETTTEVHKWVIIHPGSEEVASKFLEILESQWKLLNHLKRSTHDVDLWSMHLMAMTNKLAIYFHGDVSTDDVNNMMLAFKEMFEILQTGSRPEYKEAYNRLKQILGDFQTDRYEINTFLQQVAFELNQLVWYIYERTETFPTKVMEILNVYISAIEDIQINHRIVSGLALVKSPVEAVLEIETVADRITKMLHLIVPGFEPNKLFYRAHQFRQILDMTVFQLREIAQGSQKSDCLVKEVCQNLRKIRSKIEESPNEHNVYFKVNLGVYIQSAVLELKKLAFELQWEYHGDLVNMYGNFFSGLKHILNQIQYDFQVISDEYSIKALQEQIVSVSHHMSALLQRVQLKPQLRRVVLTQIELLASQIEGMWKHFAVLSGTEGLLAKYNQMFEQLMHVARFGQNKPVEELAQLLEEQVKEIVYDLERLSDRDLESQKFNDIYKYVLVVFGNIMVRLDNVHFYEIYEYAIRNEDFLGLMRATTAEVSNKLQTNFEVTSKIKYDFAIQILKYALSIEEVALRFQVDARVPVRSLHEIVSTLVQQVRSSQTVDFDELKSNLSRSLFNVMTVIEEIIAHESRVGTDNALIEAFLAIETLYLNIQNTLAAKQESIPMYQLAAHVDIHAHDLTNVLEHIDPENTAAFDVLNSEYRRLVQFAALIYLKLSEFSQYHKGLQHITNKLSAFEFVETEPQTDIDEVKIKIATGVQHIANVLGEFACLAPEKYEYQSSSISTGLATGESDIRTTVETLWHEFLKTIQRIRIEIGTNVLAVPNTFRGSNTPDSFNIDIHGTFEKVFNKRGNKFHGTFEKIFESTAETGGASKNKYGSFSIEFAGDDDPEHGFFRKTFHGHFGHNNRPKEDNQGTLPRQSVPQAHTYGSSMGSHGIIGCTDGIPMTYSTSGQYDSLKYYKSNEILALVDQTRNVVGDVIADLRVISPTGHKVTSHLELYVRQLGQVLGIIIGRLAEENTNDSDTNFIVKIFQQIKEELRQGAFGRPGQLKHRLSNAIKHTAAEMETLVHLSNYGGIMVSREIFFPFFQYIQNVKYDVSSNYWGSGCDSSKREINYSGEP